MQRRQAVIAGNSELREHELLKRAPLAEAMADALRKRGVTDRTASLAAELGNLAFHTAFARWAAPANQQGFDELAHQELDGFCAATTALDGELLT